MLIYEQLNRIEHQKLAQFSVQLGVWQLEITNLYLLYHHDSKSFFPRENFQNSRPLFEKGPWFDESSHEKTPTILPVKNYPKVEWIVALTIF